MLARPSRSCITLGWTPACGAIVAHLCLRSCSRICGAVRSWQPSPGSHRLQEATGEPLRVQHGAIGMAQKTRSLSVQPAPISSRSAACRLRCSRRRGDSAAVERDGTPTLAVFGVLIITLCLIAITVCRIECPTGVEIQIRPAQSQRFAAPQSRCRRLGDRLWAVCRLGRICRVGRVPGQSPPLDRVPERAMDDHVNVGHPARWFVCVRDPWVSGPAMRSCR